MNPIRKTITVPLSPEDAFRLFTERMGEWWPLDTHSLSAGEGALPRDVTVEPREGGQILETRPDGTTAPWGRITEWRPGARFGVAWHVGREEEEATDLLVVFASEGTGTRVELTHGGFERLGDAATALVANYRTGWDHVLVTCYGRACAKGRVTA